MMGSAALANEKEQTGKQTDVAYWYSKKKTKNKKTPVARKKQNSHQGHVEYTNWQQHECLYNVTCKTYHNRTDKE